MPGKMIVGNAFLSVKLGVIEARCQGTWFVATVLTPKGQEKWALELGINTELEIILSISNKM